MLEKNEINHIARYSVLKRSGEMNKIVIWPELPYWLMVNEAAVKLIDNVEGKNLKTDSRGCTGWNGRKNKI